MEQQKSGPETRVADTELAGRTCPYCRFPLKEGAEVVVCGECHAAHHADCWADNAGCAVTACLGGPGEASAATEAMNALPPTQKLKPMVISPDPGRSSSAAGFSSLAASPSQPAEPPPPPVAEAQRRPRGSSLWIALIVLALAFGGVAGALMITKKNPKSTTITQAAAPLTTTSSTPTSTTSSSTTTSTSSPSEVAPPSSTPGAAPPSGGSPPSQDMTAPDGALRHYWTLVDQGQYATAFHMETPHQQGQESAFVSDKTTAQPMINVQSIGTPSSSSGDAGVPIKLWAQDRNPSPGSDTSCRFFDMTAHMIQNGDGSWSYDGPVPGTPNVTAEPGNPNCHS